MLVLNQGLDGFLHGLIPTRLRLSLKANTGTYVRVRALTSMLLVATVITAIATVLSGSFHLLFHPELLSQDLMLLVILSLLILQTWLFYKYNNYWVSGLAFTNFYFLVTVIWIILSGGYDSQAKAILLTCPMMSFLVGSRQEGIQNAIAAIVVCLALALLHSIEFDLPNLFATQNPQLMFASNWIVTVLVIASSLTVYETELQKRNDLPGIQRNPIRRKQGEFRNQLQALIHRWIPQALRTTLDPDSIAYTRVRILSAILVVASGLSFAHALILITIHTLFDPTQLKYDSIIVVFTLCFMLQIWLFHKFHRYLLSGQLLGYFYFFMITTLVMISGGYDSPLAILLLICPVIFFMVGGILNGTVNAILIAAIGIAIGYFKQMDYDFINLFQDLNIPITSNVAWSIAIIGIAICMMTYDTELEKTE